MGTDQSAVWTDRVGGEAGQLAAAADSGRWRMLGVEERKEVLRMKEEPLGQSGRALDCRT